MEAERFRAMGTDVHVIVVGGDEHALVRRAQERIVELEHRWSRFLPASEISALNRHAGSFVSVSNDTRQLVTCALDAWRATGGLYDPTVLGALIRAGYDRSFDELARRPRSGTSELAQGAQGVEIRGNEIRLRAGTGFDPGGIGKGLAADMVAEELRAAGADGACVNLGGDVRVFGQSPNQATGGDAAWTVDVDMPSMTTPVARVGIADGAVCTSTSLQRRWVVGDEPRHHLIDPTTGEPSTSTIVAATVVAASAWAAEVTAKALLLRGAPHHFDLLAPSGAEALVVHADGRVEQTFGLAAFLGGEPLAEVKT
jgi:FAD:protein FMN transferase